MQPPFSCNNRQKLQQKIIKDKIKFPSFLTSEAHSMLKGVSSQGPFLPALKGPLLLALKGLLAHPSSSTSCPWMQAV